MLTRRQFLSAAAATCAGSARAAGKQPNILLILADDLGYSDIGCYGSEIATPHLDALAKRGIRFTQFYNGARCCPTRAALLTGLYSHQAGIGHMIEDKGFPSYVGRLNDRCVTIAEALRGNGYRTLMSGKWHVGEERPYWPIERGFDRYFGLISGASNYFRLEPPRQMAIDGIPYTPADKGFYMTDAFADHAVRQLDEAGKAGKPWFQYLAFTAPHWPLHALDDDIAKYRGKYRKGWDALRRERYSRMKEMGLIDERWPITPRDDSAPAWESVKDVDERDRKMAVYAAQIDRMDQGIGRVLAKIREMGQEENTLVMFLADNGGCAEEIARGEKEAVTGSPDSFRSYGLPWANASNTPFRLYKHWVHEGGIASPLIVSWPSGIRNNSGTLQHEPGHIIDVMATCLDVAGAAYPEFHKGKSITPLEGRSLAPLFQGKKRERRPLFWEHEGNRAVRDGKWKLVAKHGGAWELYDLEKDRTEMNDLASAEAGRVKNMAALHDAWSQKVGVMAWDEVRKKKAGA